MALVCPLHAITATTVLRACQRCTVDGATGARLRLGPGLFVEDGRVQALIPARSLREIADQHQCGFWNQR
ncbi:hypothetical protein MLP_10260 [Microlunatus phosphovorus NM-1]|uniref:Uncharacterized protein n=1 Tax=Microlunatus phosphovorus (strain ATCC 700054 / DSM 10555 / JCM 9379 / NBRC 101784 / NCIMB 13414 / VKM Ac-1990 / NM-1) TaxID=1032480 RepID=F5XMW7_MICPN|nr:hypothetical protein MLP_10260 [Microlunatus phosphovorus NM-1]